MCVCVFHIHMTVESVRNCKKKCAFAAISSVKSARMTLSRGNGRDYHVCSRKLAVEMEGRCSAAVESDDRAHVCAPS